MNEIKTSRLPEYDRPPVSEVVCGVLFESLKGLLAPHIGLLWEEYRAEYPTCEEAPPLAPAIESFGANLSDTPEFTEFPMLPRVWFVHREGNGVIQVQRDRFHHNWRRMRSEDEYPRYHKVIELFEDRLSVFNNFLASQKITAIVPIQYELTYTNPIPQGEGWTTPSDIGELLPDYAWRKREERFLPAPSAVNWRTTFNLPQELGRLHANMRLVARKSDNVPMMLLELTARGIGPDTTAKGRKEWFDLAREWIVRGFADITSGEVQRSVWGKK